MCPILATGALKFAAVHGVTKEDAALEWRGVCVGVDSLQSTGAQSRGSQEQGNVGAVAVASWCIVVAVSCVLSCAAQQCTFLAQCLSDQDVGLNLKQC